VRPGEEAVAALLSPFLDVVGEEMQKLATAYFEKTKREIKKIVLAGGTAELPGAADYFLRQLGKETVVVQPFSQIVYDSMLEPLVREIGPAFAVATGLAMRQLLQ
jgi:type IV pilus assembly protein PilM